MRPISLCLALVVALACGCGGSSNNTSGDASAPETGTPDTGVADTGIPPPDAGMSDAQDAAVGYPAPHPPLPKVMSLGGPVMTAPKIIPITFASDTMLIPQINDFVAKLDAATAYWSGATAEYGVGPLTMEPPITLNEMPAANLMDSDIQAWLASKINGATADAGAPEGGADSGGIAPFPQPDANTIYAIFYPAGVTVTMAMGFGASCQTFDAYHSDFALTASTFVSYAIMTRCPPYPNTSQIDSIAAAASHEFAEAATDPLPQDHAAYSQLDMNDYAWLYGGGGTELGDMCAPFPDSFYKPAGLPYLVQKIWSNAQAAASHDPCQPGGAAPYFNSAPVLNDTLMINDPMAGMFTTKGVKIPVGQSKTVELDLYSDAPTSGPWKVKAIDVLSTFFGGSQGLSFTFDKTTGQNGDKIQMTIKVVNAGPGNAEAFWLQSTLGGVDTVWMGLVGN